MARLLVCGGRNFTDKEFLYRVLDRLHKNRPIGVIIEGNARGADRMAGYWAQENGIDDMKFDADWETHGRSAGYIRNRLMLDQGKPDAVLAMPGGVGTAMMVRIATEAGVEIIQPVYRPTP